jgi:hypothetical protein
MVNEQLLSARSGLTWQVIPEGGGHYAPAGDVPAPRRLSTRLTAARLLGR